MNQKLAQKLLTPHGQVLLQALADGKTIELLIDGVYEYIPNPIFNADLDMYRVKPEPRVRYLLKADLDSGNCWVSVRSIEDMVLPEDCYYKFVEVLDD